MTSIAWLAEEFRKDKRVAKREETRRRWEDEAERRAERKWEDEAERLRDISGWINLKWKRSKHSKEEEWVWMRASDLRDARRRRNRRSGKSEGKRRDWAAGHVVHFTYEKTKTTSQEKIGKLPDDDEWVWISEPDDEWVWISEPDDDGPAVGSAGPWPMAVAAGVAVAAAGAPAERHAATEQ